MDTNHQTTTLVTREAQPLWAPLPAPGHRCPYCGLTRGRLYQLLNTAAGAIRQVSLREEGRARGTRLIDVPSLLAYLGTLAEAQATAASGKATT
jgi:hypothetical protein